MTLTVYKPDYPDLWFKQQMLSDEATMSYNHAWGGTISFPEERWADWYARWIVHTENKRYYRYLKNEDGQFIGEIAYHFDDELGKYLADVIIEAKHRKKGYGTAAISMLCAIAQRDGISEIYDNIAADNPAVGLFLRLGFSETYRTQSTIVLKKELQKK